MTKQELYELIDIDSPTDFQYFENLAAFLECDEELEYEDVAALIKDVEKDSSNMTQSGYLTPAADFSGLDMVLVVTEVKDSGDLEDILN